MEKFSYLQITNADYIDELFARYLRDPSSIDPTWRYFFEGLELGDMSAPAAGAAEPLPNGHAGAQPGLTAVPMGAGVDWIAEAKVAELIQAYRAHGHRLADTNPLESSATSHPYLELSRFGLSSADLEKTFQAGKLLGLGPSPLSKILAHLKATYCGTVGAEFSHIADPMEQEWLRKRWEQNRPISTSLDVETQRFILKRLTESETFERFLHTRYVAQKRFSVEGGESVIPALDCMIETGAELGAKEFVVGMAHRGRLNVLVNLFAKKPEYILTEFEGAYPLDGAPGEGDVKYHMGYSHDMKTRRGKSVHLSMASNPSHLEFVNPVIEGVVRAKQTIRADKDRLEVVPILIHGEAAFAGQGVCYETLHLSQLAGYKTGGTLHLIINNQVGFTTSPKDARSSLYSSDLAKAIDCPVFHVNGDDPQAVWSISALCVEYRQVFKKDIFIDLVCYRKHGHNEGDEPTFTQPVLYKKIRNHASPREVYAHRLSLSGAISEAQARNLVDEAMARLAEAQVRTRAENPRPYVSSLEGRWSKLHRPSEQELFAPVATAVPDSKLRELATKINSTPEGFQLHPKLGRFFEARQKAVMEGKGIDWGNGEALAFATLLDEGIPVRLSGQDAERGTFTHRHSVLNDHESGATHTPLNKIRPGQALIQIHNSHLSETGVMGFEYGYSIADPQTLVIWEAQFGDFANGAQVIIDQFLSTSESKWQRMCGLTLLLPHGFEGQGPEHSSARLERFLQLCGKNNIFVCNLTTPAQLFHALRRQVKRDFRKPLVIMSPKSLLRHPQAISTITEFSQSTFQEVLDDAEARLNTSKIRKVLLCTGKVYYDLLAERAAKGRTDVAIVRVEQLYPWPAERLTEVLSGYKEARSVAWVQEEPRNMGGWTHVNGYWNGGYADLASKIGNRPIRYVGRDICASPAVGSMKLHEKEQRALVETALIAT